MGRLNLTLDRDTLTQLNRHAKRAAVRTATLARELVREGLARRDALERRRKVAADYAAGRADARVALAVLENAQLDLLDRDDA